MPNIIKFLLLILDFILATIIIAILVVVHMVDILIIHPLKDTLLWLILKIAPEETRKFIKHNKNGHYKKFIPRHGKKDEAN